MKQAVLLKQPVPMTTQTVFLIVVPTIVMNEPRHFFSVDLCKARLF